MSIDNLIEDAQFQVVSSAGKGGAVCIIAAKAHNQSSSVWCTP